MKVDVWFVGCWRIRKCQIQRGIKSKLLDGNSEDNYYEDDSKWNDTLL